MNKGRYRINISLILIILVLSSLFIGCTKEQVNQISGEVISKGKDAIDYVDDFISNESVRDDAKIEIAIKISETIKKSNLEKIDLNKIQSYDDYKKMIDNLNLMIEIINNNAGTNIKPFNKGVEAHKKFMLKIKRYSPLIDNYNYLITYSYEFDPSDEESVNRLLTKAVGFSVESILVFGGVFYQFAFITTGTLASTFGITKLASVCAPCVSTVMSGMHWIIRNGLIEKTSEISEKGASSII